MANKGVIKFNHFVSGLNNFTCAIRKPDDSIRDGQSAVALDDTDHDNLYTNGNIDVTIEASDTVIPAIGGVVQNGAFEYQPEATVVNLSDITEAIKAMMGLTEGGTWSFEKIMTIIAAYVSGDWRLSSDGTKQELLDAEDGGTVILTQSLTRSPSAGNKYRDMTVLI